MLFMALAPTPCFQKALEKVGIYCLCSISYCLGLCCQENEAEGPGHWRQVPANGLNRKPGPVGSHLEATGYKWYELSRSVDPLLNPNSDECIELGFKKLTQVSHTDMVTLIEADCQRRELASRVLQPYTKPSRRFCGP